MLYHLTFCHHSFITPHQVEMSSDITHYNKSCQYPRIFYPGPFSVGNTHGMFAGIVKTRKLSILFYYPRHISV
jgi:hypothetical protein